MNRASRTGPLALMNEGTLLVAPSSIASSSCGLGMGFCGLDKPGLLPPVAGCAWHMAQLFALKVGPSPDPPSPGILPETESTSIKAGMDWLNMLCSLAFKPGKDPPAAAGRCAGPGPVGPAPPASPPAVPGQEQ